MKPAPVIVAASLFLLSALPAHADSFRCGGSWVSAGARKTEVLAKCGEPLGKDARTEVETIKVKEGVGESAVTREHSVIRQIEEWTYDRGPDEFIRYVRFVDGVVVKIRTGDYGTKKS